ncbi:MAG: methyl-accepting chemotaxis protein [Epsilonproteobacteria bacterium]|nr:methyl-accepting chemotaxis protein [Campylobacterota bacterium]
MILTKISSKINFIGGMLSLIVITNVVLTIYLNKKQEGDSYIINIAGRQRMLSQKITKEIFYSKSSENFDFQILNDDIETFEKNLYILINGNKKLNVYKPPNREIKEKLDQVLKIWIPFKKTIQEVEEYERDIKKDKEIMMNSFDDLLKISDKVVKAMVKENLPGHYIDLSGRQRMLSQRMGLYLVRYLDTSSQSYYYTYYEAMKMYDRTLMSFTKDSLIKNRKKLDDIVLQNYQYWKNFKTYIENLIAKENKIQKGIEYIHKTNVKLLKTMDEAVWLYTEYSEAKSDFIKNFLYISGMLALLIIFYTYFTAKALERHVKNFVEKAKELSDIDPIKQNTPLRVEVCGEDELKEASTHINKFADKVRNALEYSNEALKRAELAAKELQIIADEAELALKELGVKDRKNFGKNIDATEDIAIESAESLIHVSKMIQRLKDNLSKIIENYPDK